jgi:hypothetical protein
LKKQLIVSFVIREKNGVDVFGTTSMEEGHCIDGSARRAVVDFSFANRLAPGSYRVHVTLAEGSADWGEPRAVLDSVDMAVAFAVPFSSERPVWYLVHQDVKVKARIIV